MAIFPDEIPCFVTGRLILRPLQEEYLPFLQEVWEATGAQPMNKARGRTIYMLLDNLFYHRQGLCWAIVEKKTDLVIGTCEFHNFDLVLSSTYVGCELLPSCQRQGYMTEAMGELIRYAFDELELYDLVAKIAPDNQASLALFGKLCFERRGARPGALQRFVLSRKIS